MKPSDLVKGKICLDKCSCIPECSEGKIGIVLLSWRAEDDEDAAIVFFENKEVVVRSARKRLEILSE